MSALKNMPIKNRWLHEAHDELRETQEGEIPEQTDTDMSYDQIYAFLRDQRDSKALLTVQPNPLVTKGKPIEEDHLVPAPEWLAPLLGSHAPQFSQMPARAVSALGHQVRTLTDYNRRKDPFFEVGDKERLQMIAGSFGLKMAIYRQIYPADYDRLKMPFTASVSCWPLRVRTVGDVHRAFDETVDRLGLQRELEEVQRQYFSPPEDEAKGIRNATLNRVLLPVEMDMLCRGFSLYPILTA